MGGSNDSTILLMTYVRMVSARISRVFCVAAFMRARNAYSSSHALRSILFDASSASKSSIFRAFSYLSYSKSCFYVVKTDKILSVLS